MSAEPRALAYYLWPPRWILSPPAWVEPGGNAPVDPNDLGQLVREVDLPDGIRARVFRDGMFAFTLGPSGPTYDDDFLGWMHTLVRLMNAHSACLRAAVERPSLIPLPVITHWTAMQVDFTTGRFAAMSDRSSGGTLIDLHNARTDPPRRGDWRIDRLTWSPVGEGQLDRSFGLLRDLLDHPQRDTVLLRAELLHRAKTALDDVDPSGALTNGWTAIEGFLGDLLNAFLDENKSRNAGVDASGNALSFMPERRRKFFSGADMTARHTAELLSLVDRLPFHLYSAALRCARARNNWLHTQAIPTHEDANAAVSAAGELFELVEGIPLRV